MSESIDVRDLVAAGSWEEQRQFNAGVVIVLERLRAELAEQHEDLRGFGEAVAQDFRALREALERLDNTLN